MPVRRPRGRAAPKPRRPIEEWRAHALRVADGLRELGSGEQLAHVRSWIDQARAVKVWVQRTQRAVKSRMRVRSSRGKAAELADELLAEALKNADVRAWRASDLGRDFSARAPQLIHHEALWRAAYATVLRDGLAPWPLANAQHLVLSAGMLDLRARSRSFAALHVGILALVALGHRPAAIARGLGFRRNDAAQVRDTLREAGAISLAELYAE